MKDEIQMREEEEEKEGKKRGVPALPSEDLFTAVVESHATLLISKGT